MITGYERTDLLHIMKMNRFALKDADTAQLSFTRQIGDEGYEIHILVSKIYLRSQLSKTDD